MTPEIVVDAHARLGEGPVWDDQAEILYWVDILGKQVHAYGSGGDRVFDVGVHVGALALRRSGGLVLAVTGSFPLILALSMVFSLGGTLVILHLESSAQVLIPHWEASVPPEAGARPTGAVP